jgi:hypothetical protein
MFLVLTFYSKFPRMRSCMCVWSGGAPILPVSQGLGTKGGRGNDNWASSLGHDVLAGGS